MASDARRAKLKRREGVWIVGSDAKSGEEIYYPKAWNMLLTSKWIEQDVLTMFSGYFPIPQILYYM